jgi:hypothetical protein
MSDIDVNQCDACDSAFTETYGDEFWEATDAARRVFRSGWEAGRRAMRDERAARESVGRATRELLERDGRRSMGED